MSIFQMGNKIYIPHQLDKNLFFFCAYFVY